MTTRKLTQRRLECAMAQVQMAQVHASTWLNTDAVLVLTGWSSPTLYRRIQSGEFPKPVGRGKWRGGHVLAWLEARYQCSLS
jgi:predicted DNA-binding transcriptional regulator AlpA